MDSPSIRITLDTLEDTGFLARVLARMASEGRLRALLLSGPLGAGKTTLVRLLTSHLPGGEEAEVSSPSFNLMNLYPTRPEIAHFDLYRLQGVALDPDLEEILHDPRLVPVVEWAERLNREIRPESSLVVTLKICGPGRAALLEATDPGADSLLHELQKDLQGLEGE